MGDSCYNHKRAMVVVLILVAAGIATYFYMNRPKKTQTEAEFINNSKTIDYIKKQVPIPVKDENNSIIIVSGPLDSSFGIQLDFFNKRNSCVIPQNLTYNSLSEQNAYSLKNGKILVSLKNNNVSQFYPLAAVFNVTWKIVIIDPKNCSHFHLNIAQTGEKIVTIFPYNNTFDVIIENILNTKTRVVRYTDQGEVVNDFTAIIPDRNYLKILMAEEHNPVAGYYYTVPYTNQNSSTLKKLDDKYKVVKSFEFLHQIYDGNAYAVNNGRFSLCDFDQGNRSKLNCRIFDIESNKTLQKVLIQNDYEAHDVTLTNLPKGGVLVVSSKVNENKTQTAYGRVVKSDGKLSELFELGKLSNLIHEVYILDIMTGTYCIAISTAESIMIKCIDKIEE